MRKISNIIIILFFACNGYAQVYQAYINAADRAYTSKDFRTAMSYYGEAIELENIDNDLDLEILSKYASSAKSYNAYTKAKEAYINLLESNDSTYVNLALYELADISISIGEYEEAEKYLNKFSDLNAGTQEQKVQVQESLDNIAWVLANDTESIFDLEKLDANVNTEFSEMSPIEIDETLYYSSNNYYASDEFIKADSKIYGYTNGKSNRIDIIKTSKEDHLGHFTMDPSNEDIYFTQCQYELNNVTCQIYKQNKSGEISALPQNINVPNTHTTQPNVGIDPVTGMTVLYFVSRRTGGKGGLDIYYAPIKNGKYEGPYALDKINTAGDDVSPFYHKDSNRLFFSTNGRKSFGGYDIYATTYADAWLAPENLGSGLNSSYDDLYFSLSDDGQYGYMASNRVGSAYIDADLEACCYDIYKANLNVSYKELIAKVFDADTKEPIPGATLKLSALPSIQEEVFQNDLSKEYELSLRSDLDYDLQVSKLGYEEEEYDLDMDNEDEIKIYLKPSDLVLNAFVIDEDKNKLDNFKYSISPAEKEKKDVELKEVSKSKKISEKISKNKDYIIKVEKEGYYPEEVSISSDQLLKEAILDLDIVLRKMTEAAKTKLTLDAYLPLPLYFDNDEPDQNTMALSTTKNYHQTYLKYIAKETEFIAQNKNGLGQEESMDAEFAIKNFFATKVTPGDQYLEGFTEHLLRFLQQGSQAEIMLRGYASPRSQSEYNDALTSRRVRSVENHFYQWRGGALVSYINSGQLKLTERPLGESQAPAGISDDIADKKGSIYSVEASAERRVEILEIKSSNVNPY